MQMALGCPNDNDTVEECTATCADSLDMDTVKYCENQHLAALNCFKDSGFSCNPMTQKAEPSSSCEDTTLTALECSFTGQCDELTTTCEDGNKCILGDDTSNVIDVVKLVSKILEGDTVDWSVQVCVWVVCVKFESSN